MTNVSKYVCKVVVLLLTILLFVNSSVVAFASGEGTQTTTKEEKRYDIAVVYDNSESMYWKNSKAWSRAKYAMEIFASMLNYDKGDKLSIFPMWQVTTDGSQPSTGGSFDPVKISSKDDIDKIKNLYTVYPGDTPFEPVYEARDYLKNSDAEEKWIIVLTDGEFNLDNRNDEKLRRIWADELRRDLIEVASGGIKVQYLGFDKADELEEEPSQNFYAKKSNDVSLKDDLVGICNSIFQRSVLPDEYINGKNIKIDLSMKNLIVFVQGSGAKINGLKDSNGKAVPITLNSGQRKYNNIASYRYENATPDKSLAGQVVNFGACKKGNYILDCTGAEQVQIFYEPDVDIRYTMLDADGNVVDKDSENLVAGEYSIKAEIVDGETGGNVQNHKLLGDDVTLNTIIKSPDGSEQSYADGEKFVLEPDSSVDMKIVGTYLSDYTIEYTDEFINNLIVVPLTYDIGIKLNVIQKKSWYAIKERDEWKPIRANLTIDGHPMTDEQLSMVVLNLKFSKDIPYRCEIVDGESAIDIYIGEDIEGNEVDVKTGKYTLNATASYFDEDGRENKSQNAKCEFTVDELSKGAAWWRDNWWKVLSVIAAIIALLIIGSLPALPKKIYLGIDGEDSVSSIKRESKINIDNAIGFSCRIVPHKKTNNFNCKKKTAKFVISTVELDDRKVMVFKFGSHIFEKKNTDDVWYEGNHKVDINKVNIEVANKTSVSWGTSKNNLTNAKILVNNKNIK